MAELDFDAINKLRASMGVAPLPVPGASATAGPAFKTADEGSTSDDEPASTIDTRQAAGYDNFKKLQEEREAQKKREERVVRIKKEREKAARFAVMEGKGLADEGADEDDMAWLKGAKKRQKKIAKAEQMRRELEERERQAQAAAQYTEADLAGVKVAHEMSQFDDGEDQVLVLKDTAVDAEDDDELENLDLRDRERLQEKLDSKKRKAAYDPNDVDESGERSILAQYDEEIDGKKHKAFTLDGQGRTIEEAQAEAAAAAQPKKVAISLDILKDDTPANDYMDISQVKVKKPKKSKKSKSSKRKRLEDDDAILMPVHTDTDEMVIDELETSSPKPKKKAMYDESIIDDDDLQASLAAQRKQALKKRKKMRPEDIARQLREETSAPPDSPGVRDTIEANGEADEPALIIDETTEFVQNLRANTEDDEEERRRRQRRRSSKISNGIKSEEPHVDIDEDGDMAMSYAEAAEAEDTPERSVSRSRSIGITETGLEQEKTIDQGLGATLALLRERGLVSSTDSGDKNALYRERQKFLADKQRAEEAAERLAKEQRERMRKSGRYAYMSNKERDELAALDNTRRDQLTSRQVAEIFNKEYKPNIELSYTDDHGRQLNQKEAFKLMSHQFHGKNSGNNKTKKHLDKVEAERRREAQSTLEVTNAGGMGNAQDQQAKKHKTAGVRLQ
ncbi:hypothetical protein BS50DRAFT_504955 [Corynespora cassiicola Philippines]|uniref:SART-1 protein n=1 Tax=Corynespora cassiicola Philippines TaxID=1448308 RepID=A0A2T2N6W7_CORCC|nr:hypothetical protein BS50DRAFT_504955 [Corynespora cassiicola Philippines]